MRFTLFASVLLFACRDEYLIQPQTYARLMAVPIDERTKVVVRAHNTMEEQDVWIRVPALQNLRVDRGSGILRAIARRPRQTAAVSFTLGVLAALMVIGGGVAIDAGRNYKSNYKSNCTSTQFFGCFDLTGSLEAVTGGILTGIGAIGLITAITMGAIQFRRPDPQVKAGLKGVQYVE